MPSTTLLEIPPDCKTIADFRQEHPHVFKRVCKALTLLCKTLDLFGRACIAIAGSKCKAVNGKPRNVTAKKLQQILQHMHTQVAIYLKELDEHDTLAGRTTKPTAPALQEKIDQ